MLRGIARFRFKFTLTMAAYYRIRLHKLRDVGMTGERWSEMEASWPNQARRRRKFQGPVKGCFTIKEQKAGRLRRRYSEELRALAYRVKR